MKNETKQEIRTQIIFIICFLAAWQIVYSMSVFPELIFPSLPDIGTAFVEGFRDGSLMSYTLYSMGLIIRGLVIGIVLAFVFSSLAIVSRIFHHIYNLIVSIMDLLPGVALLPLVIMWCGIGEAAIHFMADVQKHHGRLQVDFQYLYRKRQEYRSEGAEPGQGSIYSRSLFRHTVGNEGRLGQSVERTYQR